MDKENKIRLLRILLSAVLLGVAVLVEKNCGLQVWQLLLVYLVPYLIVGYETLLEAGRKSSAADFSMRIS